MKLGVSPPFVDVARRLRCIDGRTLADHLATIKRYWNAVADLL